MAQGPDRRLFFALWPDEGLRDGIIRRRQLLGRISHRQVPDHNLHLTLVFLGDQPGFQLAGILQQADQVQSRAFELVLDRAGWFARAGVAWLGGPAVEAGRILVSRIHECMRAIGIEADSRPWAPHVTLYRKVRERPELPAIPRLLWPAREFSLVESIPGRPYQVLRTWPLESDS